MFARPSHHHSGEGQEGADMTTKASPRADKRNFGESSARISEIAYSKTVLWRTLATILFMLVLATLIWLALKYLLGVADAGQRTSGTIAALGSIGGAFFLVARFQEQLLAETSNNEDAFHQAVAALSSNHLHERVYGVQKLTGMAKRKPAFRQEVIATICNYLRERPDDRDDKSLESYFLREIKFHLSEDPANRSENWRDCEFDFTNITFHVKVDLSDCAFEEAAHFEDCRFSGRTSFVNSQFLNSPPSLAAVLKTTSVSRGVRSETTGTSRAPRIATPKPSSFSGAMNHLKMPHS